MVWSSCDPCYELFWRDFGRTNGRHRFLEPARHGIVSRMGAKTADAKSSAKCCALTGSGPGNSGGEDCTKTCVTEKPLLSHRLIQVFNRYLETGGEEAWVSTLEKSFGVSTCYFDSADSVG